jgi:hypothetical protein
MVDVTLDLQNDPERAEAIELVRGWVSAYMVAARDHATSEELSAYIATNALRLSDRPPATTLKVLLHALDYAAQTIRHLLGMCAYVSAEGDGEDPQEIELFADLRQAIWDGTNGLDISEHAHD